MTDETLISMCRELQHTGDHIEALTERRKLVAADVLAELLARNLDFFDHDPAGRRRTVVETPETREVDEGRFIAACRELAIEPDEVAGCFSRRVSVTAARKLVGDQIAFDSLCRVKRGQPRIRIVALE